MKYLLILIVVITISCNKIPEEGTIVYDVDFPPVDSCEAQGTCDESDNGSTGGTTGGSTGGSTGGTTGGSTGGSTGGTTGGVATPIITLSADSLSISESSGSTTVRASQDITASTNTIVSLGKSGTAGSNDYTLSDNITITAGLTQGSTTITGVDDIEIEGTETVIIDITSVSGGDNATESGTQQVTINLTDNDVSLLGSFSLTGVNEDFGRVQINWSVPTGFSTTNDYYRIYYTTVPPASRTPANRAVNSSDSVFEPIAGTKTSFIHGGLDSTQTYYYKIAAVDVSNGNMITMSSNEISATPLFVECTSTGTDNYVVDNSADLLAYYPFDGDLKDKSPQNGRTAAMGWPYDLSYGDPAYTMAMFGEGCTQGMALYLSGIGTDDGVKNNGLYLENLNFSKAGNDISSTNGWTVSLWANPDGDMDKFSTMFSSGNNNNHNEFQIDVDDYYSPVGRIRTFTGSNRATAQQMIIGNWYHIVVTWSSGTAKLYVNGVFAMSKSNWDWSSGGSDQWDRIRIGMNRNGTTHWKGYIDELKIYNKEFSPTEIENLYNSTLPPHVDSMNYSRPGATHNRLTWTEVKGASSYVVWAAEKTAGGSSNVVRFSGANFATSDPDITQINNVAVGCTGTCTFDHTGLNSGKYYYYRVAAVNANGTGSVNVEEINVQSL